MCRRNLVVRLVLTRHVTKESCTLDLGLENEFALFYLILCMSGRSSLLIVLFKPPVSLLFLSA